MNEPDTNPPPAEYDGDPRGATDTSSAADGAAPPMRLSLLGRLFVVPAILVGILVIGLIVVVVGFGWSSIGQRPTVAKLIDEIEASSGARHMGVLMPADKDVWLAAKELAERLQQRDKELTPDEVTLASRRLSAAVLRVVGEPAPTDPRLREAMLAKGTFMLISLGRLGTDEAAEGLSAGLSSPEPAFRQGAARGLVEMRGKPAIHALLPRLAMLLNDPDADVRLVSCAALGQLASLDDAAIIAALATKLDEDRELQWNAALALGRLGSLRGKRVLLSMLDRDTWRKTRIRYDAAESPTAISSPVRAAGASPGGMADPRTVDEPFPEPRIETYLIAAIDASAELKDAELREAVSVLRRDSSWAVRDRAGRAMKTMDAAAGAASKES